MQERYRRIIIVIDTREAQKGPCSFFLSPPKNARDFDATMPPRDNKLFVHFVVTEGKKSTATLLWMKKEQALTRPLAIVP